MTVQVGTKTSYRDIPGYTGIYEIVWSSSCPDSRWPPSLPEHQQTGVLLYHIICFPIYYTHYITIITLLYHLFFCKCPDYYFTLLHYPGIDYYITYDSSIISLIVFRIYYGHYYDYHTIICIIFTSNYYCYYLY